MGHVAGKGLTRVMWHHFWNLPKFSALAIVGESRINKPRSLLPRLLSLSLIPQRGVQLTFSTSVLGHTDPFLHKAITTCSCIFGQCHFRTLAPTYANLPGEKVVPQSWDIFKGYKTHSLPATLITSSSHQPPAPRVWHQWLQKIGASSQPTGSRPWGGSVSTIWLDIISIPTAFWNFVLLDQTGFSCAPLPLQFSNQVVSP